MEEEEIYDYENALVSTIRFCDLQPREVIPELRENINNMRQKFSPLTIENAISELESASMQYLKYSRS